MSNFENRAADEKAMYVLLDGLERVAGFWKEQQQQGRNNTPPEVVVKRAQTPPVGHGPPDQREARGKLELTPRVSRWPPPESTGP